MLYFASQLLQWNIKLLTSCEVGGIVSNGRLKNQTRFRKQNKQKTKKNRNQVKPLNTPKINA